MGLGRITMVILRRMLGFEAMNCSDSTVYHKS